MHPQSDVLYCANQDSDSIVAFKVLQHASPLSAAASGPSSYHQVTGAGGLEPLGEPLVIPTPVCVAFL
jgi:6-phosphogluconolactonase (cycloisomerase 2 family)